jgi:hypothetical protein
MSSLSFPMSVQVGKSSLVINIVGTDDISLLPRLDTGLTEVGCGGGGHVNTPLPRCPVYTPQSVVSRNSLAGAFFQRKQLGWYTVENSSKRDRLAGAF